MTNQAIRNLVCMVVVLAGVAFLGVTPDVSADARDDAIQYCRDYNEEKGVRICDAQRCPCGRATFEVERFDAPRLQTSRCACVNKKGYEEWRNTPPESQCNTNSDCNDGVWCNGVESCSVSTWTAPNGNTHQVGQCRPGTPPCEGQGQCREDMPAGTPCHDQYPRPAHALASRVAAPAGAGHSMATRSTRASIQQDTIRLEPP